MVPVFQGGDLCVIMEKGPHTIAPEVSCKFRILLLVIDSNCVAPVFQGVHLSLIMEKRPHKTHYLTGFVQLLERFCLLSIQNSNCA